MKLQEIKERVQEIENEKYDDETAHGYEDALLEDFIKYISTLNNYELAQKAKEVLKTKEISFCRWCA